MPNNPIYIHALNTLQCIGPKNFEKLGFHFHDNYQNAWNATEEDLKKSGITEESAALIVEKKKTINVEKEYEKLQKTGIRIIDKNSPEYPSLLLETPLAPAALYVRGTLIPDEFSLAVVGTRKPTQYGKEACKNISNALITHSITITSGLAFGIDGIAHQEAVLNKKRTVAILGSGIDDTSLYPQTHLRLAHEILKNDGVLISEFPPNTPALPHHFPQRNRIVAGMTKGTIVIEAKEKSGALITARLALEYNRDVFAIPGSIFSQTSKGPHALIKEGAMLVESPEDILTSYNIQRKEQPLFESLNEIETRLVSLLDSPLSFEELRQKSGLEISILNATLSMLELKNVVANAGNNTYIRIH